ncbi:carbohydrate ABC transporter permease [uncultured Robinsoniella sp.]|uniref:carbohydrate ABC transporter permease n=1 Tax=uncultured Robinsoniella sp. TaxID=904190 RepID=UPI00374F617D
MQKQNKLRNRSLKYSIFWPVVFIAPFIIFYLVFNIYPLLYSLRISFYKWDGIGEQIFVGIKNYTDIITKDPNFWKAFGNTLIIIIITYPIAILLGLIIASFLSSLKKGVQFFQTVNFLPYITTPVAIGLIFSFLFDWNSGIVNSVVKLLGGTGLNWLGEAWTARLVIAFMIGWKYIGYYMALYLAGITSISEELYEAAKVDGAGVIQTFVKITTPMLKPITMFIVMTSIIGGLQLFDEPNLLFPATLFGGPEKSCLTMVAHFYDVSFMSTSRLGYGTAVAFSLFMIIVVFSVCGNFMMKRKAED